MKAMLTAFAATAVIAIGADFILGQAGFSSQEQATGAAVRLDD
ncbi:hypothetical protein [uncultured Tateyamaria sp.]|nr:hypothetical protein [uncultured Tateyamaria sp.]